MLDKIETNGEIITRYNKRKNFQRFFFVHEVEITSNDEEPYGNEMILSRECEEDRVFGMNKWI